MTTTLTVDSQGRVVLPKDVRTLLGVENGGRIHLQIDKKQIALVSLEEAIKKYRGIWRTQDMSVGTFLEEKHKEAKQEWTEMERK